jgi:hypothetical protein
MLKSHRDEWELVVAKTMKWVRKQLVDSADNADVVIRRATVLFEC